MLLKVVVDQQQGPHNQLTISVEQLGGAVEALPEIHATLQLCCVQLESTSAAPRQTGQLAQGEAAPMPPVESRIVRIDVSKSTALFRQQLCLEEGSRHLSSLERRALAAGMRLVHAAAAHCHAQANGGISKGEYIFVQLRGLVTAELRRPASSGNGGASSGGGGDSDSSGAPILWIAHSSHGGGAGALCLEMGGYASLLAAAERDVRVRCGDHLIGVLLEVAGAAGGKDEAMALATDLKSSFQNPQPGNLGAALKSVLSKLAMATACHTSAATAPPSTAFAALELS
ncbi:hypothetical protein ABPG77_001071 [Micractinium sp. CCAP 211/92]